MEVATLLENKLIVFQIDGREYAISVQMVGSIERLIPITRVPSTPSYIKGVINLRGVVTPVIDLKQRFHQKSTEFTNQTRIIIVHLNDLTIGIIVEAANDVVDINKEQIEPPPETIDSKEVVYINGVVRYDKRLLVLLDLEKVLQEQQMLEVKGEGLVK